MKLTSSFWEFSGADLHLAVKMGDIKQVEKLVRRGVNINCISVQSNLTACQIAASYGDFEMLKCLVSLGADLNAGHVFSNVVDLAIRNDDIVMVEFLLEHNAVYTKTARVVQDCKLMEMAVQYSNYSLMEKVYNLYTKIYPTPYSCFPFESAFRAGLKDRRVVEFFCQKGWADLFAYKNKAIVATRFFEGGTPEETAQNIFNFVDNGGMFNEPVFQKEFLFLSRFAESNNLFSDNDYVIYLLQFYNTPDKRRMNFSKAEIQFLLSFGAFGVCTALHHLRLPALVTCEILQARYRSWQRLCFHHYWNFAIAIRHFN